MDEALARYQMYIFLISVADTPFAMKNTIIQEGAFMRYDNIFGAQKYINHCIHQKIYYLFSSDSAIYSYR